MPIYLSSTNEYRVAPYYNSFSPDQLTGTELDSLLALGWYRMHQTIFTTSHVRLQDVYRVHWLRYSIPEIQTHTSHRKIHRRNAHLHFTIEDFNTIPPDYEKLYQRYYASIDFEGAMSIEECLFGETISENIYRTKCVSIFDGGQLVASGYFDMGDQAAASILHFFDPRLKKNSPGKLLILLTIDFLKRNKYKFYYPGYVVEGNPKMDYKLFLGRESAQYFDPETTGWEYFKESILTSKL